MPDAVPIFTLADVKAGNIDRLGYTIECLYAVSPDYAVYRSNKRVSVQYSDTPATALAQQTQLGPLNMLRGQISSLIDGWREGSEPGEETKTSWRGQNAAALNKKRAERYDRQVADALLSALQGQLDIAKNQLSEIKNDIVSERQSIARIDYLVIALAMTCLFIFLSWILSLASQSAWLDRFGPPLLPVWTAVAGGTLGAFFSIATGIKNRTVLMDLQNRDNRADATLRMLIGAISGGVLLVMLSSDLVTNALVTKDALIYPSVPGGTPYSEMLVYILGFVAGFAERLVPDQLEKARLALEDKAPQAPPPPAPASAPPPPPPADQGGIANPDGQDGLGTGDSTAEFSPPPAGTSSAN